MSSDGFGLEETNSTVHEFFHHVRETRWRFGIVFGVMGIIFIIGLATQFFLPEHTSEQYANFVWWKIMPLIMVLSGMSLVVLGIQNGGIFFGTWEKQKELSKIQSMLRRRTYLTIFDLVEPMTDDYFYEMFQNEGEKSINKIKRILRALPSKILKNQSKKSNLKHEKIINHLSYVFPDIKKSNKDRILNKFPPENMRLKKWPHILRDRELPILTSVGAYAVEFVKGDAKFKDIIELVESFSRKRWWDYVLGKANIQRLIIIVGNFEEGFEEDLDKKIGKLKKHFKVDIIHEKDFGYSTMLIDK